MHLHGVHPVVCHNNKRVFYFRHYNNGMNIRLNIVVVTEIKNSLVKKYALTTSRKWEH
jgi:hypothetical protein